MKSIYPDELYKKFPIKYGRDYGEKITPDKIAKGLLELVNKGANDDELADYIDGEFLFGAWGGYCKDMPHLFLNDVRGVMAAIAKLIKAGTITNYRIKE